MSSTPTIANHIVIPTPKTKRNFLTGRVMTVSLPIIATAVLLGIWELVVVLMKVPAFLVPAPSQIWGAYLEFQGFLWQNTLVTLNETLLGFALSIAVAVPIGIIIASSKFIEATVYPMLLTINAVPKVAIAPLLVIWMGFGILPKVVMVFLLCFFPIVISTATGLRSTATELIELSKSMGASTFTTFMKIRMPWATQQIFVGLKVAISLAVIGAVISEFVGASEGLGYIIVQSGANANTALAFASMALLGLISIVLFYILVYLEKLLIPWAEDTE
ncbi:MAG: ABC transporter permease [Microbacteriaceae bacterium]